VVHVEGERGDLLHEPEEREKDRDRLLLKRGDVPSLMKQAKGNGLRPLEKNSDEGGRELLL